MDRYDMSWTRTGSILPLVVLLFAGAGAGAQEKSSSKAPRAVEVETGRDYPGGTRLIATANGVLWTLPQEWLGHMPEGSPALAMASKTRAGLGLVFFLSDVGVADIAAKLDEEQALDETLVLRPSGRPEIAGTRVTLDYAGEENGGYALGVAGPERQGVVYFFAGPHAEAAYYRGLLEKLAASTEFRKPEPASLVQRWKELLGGTMLKQMSSYTSGTSGGYSSERVWHLCADGRYTHSSSSSMSVYVDGATGTGIGQGGSSGRWRVEASGPQAVLVLESDEGAVERLALQYDGEKTFLDGERVFRVESDACP